MNSLYNCVLFPLLFPFYHSYNPRWCFVSILSNLLFNLYAFLDVHGYVRFSKHIEKRHQVYFLNFYEKPKKEILFFFALFKISLCDRPASAN